MRSSRAARAIGAFRTSGLNPRPTPQPAYAPESAEGDTVHLGSSRAAQRVQARVDAARGITLCDPPQVAAATPAATVHLDGVPVRVALGWSVALSSRALYMLDTRRDLHVLVIDSEGDVRALQGLPSDLIADLIAAHFPRGAR